MDQANSAVLDSLDFTSETLLHAEIFGHDDAKVGHVTHVHGMGTASQIVINVGGFLGIGAKSVIMAARDLVFTRDQDGQVRGQTSLTKDQVHALPEHLH